MPKNIANIELNTDRSMEITLERRLEKVIAVWESDSSSFKKLDSEIDIEDEMFTVLNELKSKNLWSEIERLDRALQCQPKRYKECSKYISQTLIPLYLAEDRENSKEQKSRIEDYLKPFYEYPEKSCETLFNVLDKLICYDQSSIAVDLCKKIYTKIAKSDEFFINPKVEIAEIIVWDELQDAYIRFKKNMDVDWISYDKRFRTYEFQFTHDDFKSFEEVMRGRLDLTEMFKTFKNKIPLVLFQIKLAFCCQMYDLDETSFVTSNNFSSKVIDFLTTIPGREKCLLHVFFKIKPDFLMPYVRKLVVGEWFDSTYKQFAFLGALPIFYLVLLKIGIIEMKTIEKIFPTVIVLKSEYEKICLDRPWTFNFIKKLSKQSSLLAQSYQHQKSGVKWWK
ncbi:MAG: hypothetical protein H0T62_06375 [Parachlamydiaceae bacterium]|nr:hypothetical protein [Parachlamydiaceae bacterium]